MVKDFKFLRGDEKDDEIITQIEWNRRRDALAERFSLENTRIEIEQERVRRELEINQIFDRVLEELEKTEQKVSIWSKVWTRLKNPFLFVPITVFGGLFTLYWILRLVSALIKY